LSAADLIVHPSITEASSSLIKEAGLVNKPVIVCSGVGDFDQYIEHDKNGYLIKGDNEAAEF
jgi:glycosyltransferase involved in cell wall biosynthesis